MVFHHVHGYVTFRRLIGKRRLFVAFITVITISVMYVCYQAFSIRQLGEELSAQHEIKRKESGNFIYHRGGSSYQKADFPVHLLKTPSGDGTINDLANNQKRDETVVVGFRDHGIHIRGVLVDEIQRYIPNSRGNFRCTISKEEIAYHRVNDNYCDCNDGSDEPSTSACQDGRFFCGRQPSYPARRVSVLSSRVNDGICDCCDGSDEWAALSVPEHAYIDGTLELLVKQNALL